MALYLSRLKKHRALLWFYTLLSYNKNKNNVMPSIARHLQLLISPVLLFIMGCSPQPHVTTHLVQQQAITPSSNIRLHSHIFPHVDHQRVKRIQAMLAYSATHYPINTSLHLILWNKQNTNMTRLYRHYCDIISPQDDVGLCLSELSFKPTLRGAMSNYSTDTQQAVILGDNDFWQRRSRQYLYNHNDVAYLVVSAHEYFHAYQNNMAHYHAHKKTLISPEASRCETDNTLVTSCIRYLGPMWLTEGTAEFVGLLLSAQRGHIQFDDALLSRLSLSQLLHQKARLHHTSVTLKDHETMDDILRIRDELGMSNEYAEGVWAVLYLIAHAGKENVLTHYYQALATLPRSGDKDAWEMAFATHMQMDIHTFYERFAAFKRQPIEAQMAFANKVWHNELKQQAPANLLLATKKN